MKSESPKQVKKTDTIVAIAIVILIVVIGLWSMCCATSKHKMPPGGADDIDCVELIKAAMLELQYEARILTREDAGPDVVQIDLLEYECVAKDAAILLTKTHIERGSSCKTAIQIVPIFRDEGGVLRVYEDGVITEPVSDDPRCNMRAEQWMPIPACYSTRSAPCA